MPILPPAPPRSSTTICCPSFSERNWPISRATMSLAPPAANETIQRTGREGKACAHAGRDRSAGDPARATAPASCRNRRRGRSMALPSAMATTERFFLYLRNPAAPRGLRHAALHRGLGGRACPLRALSGEPRGPQIGLELGRRQRLGIEEALRL